MTKSSYKFFEYTIVGYGGSWAEVEDPGIPVKDWEYNRLVPGTRIAIPEDRIAWVKNGTVPVEVKDFRTNQRYPKRVFRSMFPPKRSGRDIFIIRRAHPKNRIREEHLSAKLVSFNKGEITWT
jgi:hypothetical protein